MTSQQEILDKLNNQIDFFFTQKINNVNNPRSKELLNAAKNLILIGGKRSRPKLFLLTCQAYQNKLSPRLVKLAMSIEIYHQFLLIHDDIIDKDYYRYNQENIMGYYQKEFGGIDDTIPKSMALLGGDLLYSFVFEIIIKDDYLSDKQKVDIINLLTQINEKVCLGQQLDSLNVKSLGSRVNQEDIIDIHKLKTAPYSIQLPMRLAGILANLPIKETYLIDRFAESFGIYYQLADDYSDYFDNKSLFNNRPKYRDYKEGRTTMPYIFSLNNSTPKNKSLLENYFGVKSLSEESMSKIIKIMIDSNGELLSLDSLNLYYNQTKQNLKKLNISKEYIKQFMEIINNLKI